MALDTEVRYTKIVRESFCKEYNILDNLKYKVKDNK
jgi:hypothetical protein